MTLMSGVNGQTYDIMSLIVFMTLDIDVLDIDQTLDIGFLTLNFLTLALTLDSGDIHHPGSPHKWNLARSKASRGHIQLQSPNQLIVF